jgi:hypothetical protein
VRAAVPVDRAVGSHQRRTVEVADQAVLGDWKVVVHARGSTVQVAK